MRTSLYSYRPQLQNCCFVANILYCTICQKLKDCRIKILPALLFLILPMTLSAALTIPAIPGNSTLAKRFERSTELAFRVKAGDTYLPSGALIAYINNEIRGAQTASVLFPPTGQMVYKILIYNDAASGDMISFKYYDIFSEKIYDITEQVEFIPDQVPDFANPATLTAFCSPVAKVTGMLPENDKDNQNSVLDLYWQPSPNTSYYNLFLWEEGSAVPTTPYRSNIYATTTRIYGLDYGKTYHWKIASLNDCSSVESNSQTFKVRELPDLTVTDIQMPAEVVSGTDFTVAFNVKNVGAGGTYATQWNDAVYVSSDAIFSSDDRLLNSGPTLRQLEPDSSYTQSITVRLPNEYTGAYHIFVKADYGNTLAEITENNNTVKATNALTVALKSLPDILVNGIQTGATSVLPGDSLLISWNVQNTGSVAAPGGWTERVSLVPVNGLKVTLDAAPGYNGDLAAGATVSRSNKYRIPEIVRFSGSAKVEVELIPSATLVEHTANTANNKALSTGSITMGNTLSLAIQTASLLENSPNAVRCVVSRSGDYTNALAVNISASPAGQVTVPPSIVIPINNSSVVFNLNAVNNDLLEGARNITITTTATGYQKAEGTLNIIDDEVPKLTALLDKTSLNEGEPAQLTISRDLVTNQPLMVNVSTNKSSQWTFASPVNIPANAASVVVPLQVTDDQVPELNAQAMITATSAGYISGTDTAMIIDNDIPEVSFRILSDTISESAGIYATWGVISRVKGDDHIKVNLTANLDNALFFPASVTLPKGTNETKFNIGVVDNGLVDGFRAVNITGSIYISTCNCGTSAENGGIVQDKLVIADNDGPTLNVTVDPVSLYEGKTDAGKLIISRNTSTENPLEVNISYNDPSELQIQAAATIPAGQASVKVPVNTLNDNVEDGDQMVSIQAKSAGFTSGYCFVYVTDQNKPDLSIKTITLNLDSAVANGLLEIRGFLYNTGYLTAPSGVKVAFYLSKDKLLDANDVVLGEYATSAPLIAGDSVRLDRMVSIPKTTGKFYVIAKANPESQVNELVYSNNTSNGIEFTILPEYSARAVVDPLVFKPNETIPIHGNAYISQNVPAVNVDVDVYVLSNGTRREFSAKTNAQGTFSLSFTPATNETGHYTVGACYPKQNLSAEQDAFDILGMRREPAGNIIWEMKQGETLKGVIGIKNSSNSKLTNLVVEQVSVPKGCQLTFDTIAVLQGDATRQFNFTVKATELSSGQDYEKAAFLVKSAEGATLEIPAYYYCQALQGQLKADPVSINTTMTKGQTRLYEVAVFNNGAGATGQVTIAVPDVSWMKLVSPATLSNIAPMDTATVILQLSPGNDIPLNTPISGAVAVNCVNGSGVQIPYRIEAVSEATGHLKVDVVDEYTYYTEAAPHVKNAHVVVRHPFSGQVVAEGFTDSTGIFLANNLPEGAYKMTVEVDKHEGYQNTIIIDPGRVSEQKVYLSFQAISYTWEVVPTEIEDKYEVELVMKFETNVPVPVVVVEMPKEMPQLVGDETYPFLVTITNKGLITAKDVDITFPSDPEYEFVTNFTKLDLLAQQAIQIPVVMKRRDASLRSASATTAAGNCTDYVYTIYGWECGPDKKWQQSQHGITFTGRVCPGTPAVGGTPGGGGYYYGPSRGGGGGTYYTPTASIPSVSAPEVGCDKCLIDVAQAVLNCVKLHPGVAVAVNAAGCLYSFMDFDITALDVFNCVVGFLPTKYVRDGYKCALAIANAAKTCYEDPPFFLKSSALRSASTSKMPPILKQGVHDLEAFLYGNDAVNGYVSEIIGNMDWQSKENFNDFLKLIQPFAKDMRKIQGDSLALIQQQMLGTDISNIEINAFANRWNRTLDALKQHIMKPTAEFPDIVNNDMLVKNIQRADSVRDYAISRGYTDIDDMYFKSMETINDQIESGRNSVCSSVSIKISQQLVMTREAFEGTLTIYNGNKTTAMNEVKLDLEIRDEDGNICNDLFQIETKAVDILTGIDGTGSLGPDQKGSATILFIPEKGAAPQVPKNYSFGGSFSYLDPFTSVTVTKPLFPVTLAVNPSPDLYLHYFMQRDILGDDPLTEPVEPIVPAELALMIQNNGYGTAKNVRIESAQPKIVENQKGLAVNFALVGSNLNGQPRQLGLTKIDFGNIAPKSSTIGQWWFTSDLLGHLVSYEAKVTHLDSRGNPDLSLISGATMHELIKSIRVYDGVEDNVNDFLVNEVQDSKEMPDAIYLSNGGVLDVYPASGMTTAGNVTAPAFEVELTVVPSHIGWNYSKKSDPGNGNFRVMSVTRDDGQQIPLDNVWQTHVTLPDGEDPVYENMLHFTDIFKSLDAVKYKIRYAPKDQAVPYVVSIDSVPTEFVTQPLTSVTVVFNKAIDPATFDYHDMTLRVQGGNNLMDSTVNVSQINPTTYKVDFAAKTLADGYYVLNIQTTEISDVAGIFGETGKQVSWTQFAHIPAVEQFIGLPENKAGAPIDFIMIKFNVPIDVTSVVPARFSWTKNGEPVSGSIGITPMDTEGKLFRISGLKAFLPDDADYTLTVNLPGITSLEGINGLVPQSVSWEIDQMPPKVSKISLRKEGGFDAQHVTAIDVEFNEPVTGFGISSIELWKDGLRQPLSQLTITNMLGSTYRFTQFRLLTYYEGNYTLKIKMDGVADNSGNTASGIVEHKWLVSRKLPKAVTNLSISPDFGFSSTDAVTSVRTVAVTMMVNESRSGIRLYQNDLGNRTLLADTLNVDAGMLTLPVKFTISGNLTLEAHCIDSLTNEVSTELPVYIDEVALQATWKSVPTVAVTVQPDSLLLVFSEKLLDDALLKGDLILTKDGQSLATDHLTISKLTDKIYVLRGLKSYDGDGIYALSIDLTQLKKYSSGQQGATTSLAQWMVEKPNQIPVILKNAAIRIYPNPSEGILNVRLAEPFASGYIVAVYDQLGRAVRIFNKDKSDVGFSIDLSQQASGVYTIQFVTDDFIIKKKVIKL